MVESVWSTGLGGSSNDGSSDDGSSNHGSSNDAKIRSAINRCRYCGIGLASLRVDSRGARNYRDLIAWQAAIQLASDIETVCKQLPRSRWKLIQQMTDAARGVHSTIAEGNGRFSTRDYLRFLAMANGSLKELQSDLIALRRSKPTDPAVRTALNRTYIVEKLLTRLTAALRRKLGKDGEAA